MWKIATRIGLIAVVALASYTIAPRDASAQYREFVGRIDQISGQQMVVGNRRGDTMAFVRSDATRVQGEGKTGWKNLKKNDRVSVSWKMMDKPPVAHRVVVLPPRME